MTNAEIESYARAVVQSAKQMGRAPEDDRIEFKRELPTVSHERAKRIAGHCNQAAGDWAMWIVGVSDDGHVITPKTSDSAQWWPRMQSCFQEIAPDLKHELWVAIDDQSVLVLMFDTSRSPYVVKRNPSDIRDQVDDLIVPWREATRVRSARRQELIDMLVPRARIPKTVALRADVTRACFRQSNEYWTGSIDLYFSPRGSGRTSIPYHRSRVRIIGEGNREAVVLLTGGVDHPGQPRLGAPVCAFAGNILIDGPGVVQVGFSQPKESSKGPSGFFEPIALTIELKEEEDRVVEYLKLPLLKHEIHRWEFHDRYASGDNEAISEYLKQQSMPSELILPNFAPEMRRD